MSWCDKLASTPAIGVLLDKVYAPVTSLLDPLTPVVSKWVDKERDQPAFSVDHQDPFACTLSTFDGYTYTIGPESLGIEFRHRLRLKPQSAGPPTAEMLSKPQPYTKLLSEIEERFLELIRLETTGKNRKLLRIGVVSTTVVDEGEIPPGVARFLKRMAKPWDTSPEFFNVELGVKLPKVKGTLNYDRCIHVFSRPEKGDGLVNIRLDFQRYVEADRSLSPTSLPGLLTTAKSDALAYFEDIGQGDRFNE